jgi:hypothetical protein
LGEAGNIQIALVPILHCSTEEENLKLMKITKPNLPNSFDHDNGISAEFFSEL